MQEIKKRRIVLASLLKPVNDTRMFEKLGVSLSREYDVHVIGYEGQMPVGVSPVTVHPLRPFKRIGIGRVLRVFTVLWRVVRLQPDVLIICTHELLWISLVAKALTGCRVIYDVQENYALNILHSPTFPPMLRALVAGVVRAKERLSKGWISLYILAEAGYEKELAFPGKRKVVLENKVRSPQTEIRRPPKNNEHDAIQLLFSGTLAETTGVFVAVDVASKLHALDERIRLLIMGYCSHAGTFQKLQALLKDKPFVTLQGGDRLVPHAAILDAIQAADFGIVSYPPNPSTLHSTPTKLYEYLAYRLPMLLVDHPDWVARCAPYRAAVIFNPENVVAGSLLDALKTGPFYTVPPRNIYWEDEENALFKAIVYVLA
jgi:glycosyltransferase involved in cell wall biosynthesis